MTLPIFLNYKVNITKHCVQRYSERIRNIPENISESYVKVNKEKLNKEIFDRFKRSENYSLKNEDILLNSKINGHQWAIKHNNIIFIVMFDKLRFTQNIMTCYKLKK